MATAQIAERTLTARITTAPFDAGFVPVAPTSTATRLADRWLFFVRAIDSSFSAAVTSRGRWDAGTRGGCPVLLLLRARPGNRPVHALSHLRVPHGFG